ncbi:hypothetical protein DNAM5_110 [Haloarcula californiae tailed virus 1]|uniref:Uncharacterized protein n=1 Tax=Haloarcula californiae tailed virus 1 TaxID=1273746 RepID=R4T876_9CAUD|nr:hypothetical protein M202_gp109 [Haloarcula californiae tailed virus 1]AGM11969.1 hypothetical protein DNAM5_110 [Haloarcula californiae tailed virus 1]UBF23097.1 Zn finger [Haloarcula virus HCTV-16]
MTECPNCGENVSAQTEKNLKGRPSAKAQPQECPECGHELEKAPRRSNRNLLNK